MKTAALFWFYQSLWLETFSRKCRTVILLQNVPAGSFIIKNICYGIWLIHYYLLVQITTLPFVTAFSSIDLFLMLSDLLQPPCHVISAYKLKSHTMRQWCLFTQSKDSPATNDHTSVVQANQLKTDIPNDLIWPYQCFVTVLELENN